MHITSSGRPAVGVYLRYYLPPSMTFVHRQLVGVAESFRPVVMTSSVSHLDRFPWEPIHARKRALSTRLRKLLPDVLDSRPWALSKAEEAHWRDVLERENAQLVHAHFGAYGLEILPVARDLGLPLLVTFHGFGASRLLKVPSYVERLPELFEYADVLAVSDNLARRLIEAGVPTVLTRYDGMIHAFLRQTNRFDKARTAVAEIAEHLRRADVGRNEER